MPRTPLAEALWELIRQHSPDFVVDLHEGFDSHISNSKSVGSSVICSASERRTALAQQMLNAVNAGITDETRRFELLSRSGAVRGSMVRAATDFLKTDAFILETTFKDQPLSLRTRQHRLKVSTLFKQIGLIDEACQDVLTAREASRVNVALFDGEGASSNGLKNLSRVLGREVDLAVTRVGPADIQPEILQQFHVVLFPGGSGSRQGKAIGKTGREAVRGFAQTGGGIVGVCAGAYLCSSHYDWSLHVINTAVFNKTVEIPGAGRKSMWYREGPHDVDMELSAAAEPECLQIGHPREVHQPCVGDVGGQPAGEFLKIGQPLEVHQPRVGDLGAFKAEILQIGQPLRCFSPASVIRLSVR